MHFNLSVYHLNFLALYECILTSCLLIGYKSWSHIGCVVVMFSISLFLKLFDAEKEMKIGEWEILLTLSWTEDGWKNVLPMQKVMIRRWWAIKLLHSGWWIRWYIHVNLPNLLQLLFLMKLVIHIYGLLNVISVILTWRTFFLLDIQ